MEIKKTNRNITKKHLAIVIMTLLLLFSVGSVGAYLITAQKQPDDTKVKSLKPDTSLKSPSLDTPATNDEIHTGNTAKDNTINNSGAPIADMSVSVIANKAGDVVRITTEINKLVSQGSCSITLMQGNKTIKRDQVSIQPLSTYSTCNGWDIASSELSSGKWTIMVNVVSGSESASSTTEVSI